MEGRKEAVSREWQTSRDVIHLDPESFSSASVISHPLPESQEQEAAPNSRGSSQEIRHFPVLSHQPGDGKGVAKPPATSRFRHGAKLGKLGDEERERPAAAARHKEGKSATFNLQGNTLHEIPSRSDQRREAEGDGKRDKERALEEQRRLIEQQVRFQKACDSARYLVQCRLILHNIGPPGTVSDEGTRSGERGRNEATAVQGRTPEICRKTAFLEIERQPEAGEVEVLGHEGEEETTFLLRSVVGFLKPEELSDVALERESLGKCGFFLCSQQMPTGAQKRGRLSLVRRWKLDHKLIRVADEDDLLLFCSKECYYRQKELQGLQREEQLYTRLFVQQWVSRVSSRCKRDGWRDVADPAVGSLALGSTSLPSLLLSTQSGQQRDSEGLQSDHASSESRLFASGENPGAAQSPRERTECVENQEDSATFVRVSPEHLPGGDRTSSMICERSSCTELAEKKGDFGTVRGLEGDKREDLIGDKREGMQEGDQHQQVRGLRETKRQERETEKGQSRPPQKPAHVIKVTVEDEDENSSREESDEDFEEADARKRDDSSNFSSRGALSSLGDPRVPTSASDVATDLGISSSGQSAEKPHSTERLLDDKEGRLTQTGLLNLQWCQHRAAGPVDPVLCFDYADVGSATDVPANSAAGETLPPSETNPQGLPTKGHSEKFKSWEEEQPDPEGIFGRSGSKSHVAAHTKAPRCSPNTSCELPKETMELNAERRAFVAGGASEAERRESDIDSNEEGQEWEEGFAPDDWGLAKDLNEFLDLTDEEDGDTCSFDCSSPDHRTARGSVCCSQQEDHSPGECGTAKLALPSERNKTAEQPERRGSRKAPSRGKQSIQAQVQEAYGRLSDLSVVWDLLGNWSRNETREFLIQCHGLKGFSRKLGGERALSSFDPSGGAAAGPEAPDNTSDVAAATAEDIQRVEQLVQVLIRVLPTNLVAQYRRQIVDLCSTFRIQRAAPPLQPSCCRTFLAVVLTALQCRCWTASSPDLDGLSDNGTDRFHEEKPDSHAKSMRPNIKSVKEWLSNRRDSSGDDEGLREFILEAVFEATSKPQKMKSGENQGKTLFSLSDASGEQHGPQGFTAGGQAHRHADVDIEKMSIVRLKKVVSPAFLVLFSLAFFRACAAARDEVGAIHEERPLHSSTGTQPVFKEGAGSDVDRTDAPRSGTTTLNALGDEKKHQPPDDAVSQRRRPRRSAPGSLSHHGDAQDAGTHEAIQNPDRRRRQSVTRQAGRAFLGLNLGSPGAQAIHAIVLLAQLTAFYKATKIVATVGDSRKKTFQDEASQTTEFTSELVGEIGASAGDLTSSSWSKTAAQRVAVAGALTAAAALAVALTLYLSSPSSKTFVVDNLERAPVNEKGSDMHAGSLQGSPMGETSTALDNASFEGAPISEFTSRVDAAHATNAEQPPAGETSSGVEEADIESAPAGEMIWNVGATDATKVEQRLEGEPRSGVGNASPKGSLASDFISAVDATKVEQWPACETSSGVEESTLEGTSVSELISAVDAAKAEGTPADEPSSGVEASSLEGSPMGEAISGVETTKVEQRPADETSSGVERASVEDTALGETISAVDSTNAEQRPTGETS
ncbi:Rtr1/RPAP2 family protein, partial [Toxoplasma gondii CAST]